VVIAAAVAMCVPRSAHAAPVPVPAPIDTTEADSLAIEAMADSLAAVEAEADTIVHPRAPEDSSGGAVEIGQAPRRTRPTDPKGFGTPFWVMMRSVVVPGWGQAYNHAWWKAAAIAGTESYLIARLVSDHNKLSDLNTQIEAGDPNDEDLINQYNSVLNNYSANQWWLGLTVVYSMLDAYIDAHFRNFKVEFGDDEARPKGGSTKPAKMRVMWRKSF
jgi:Family of unknown function (DUF5683)